jgi:hypothetical protein
MVTMTILRIRFSFFVQYRSFLADFPKVGLRDLHPVCISPPNTSECLNQYLRNLEWRTPSQQSVCLYVNPSYRYKATARFSVSLLSAVDNGSVYMFPRQQTHATVEELLDAAFSMRFASYPRKTGDLFFPELLV